MSSFLPISDRNLILTGYIGPDLPLLGRQIAQRLRKPYVNVDTIIAERLDLSVDDIRTYFGETRLKAVEAEIVQETALRRDSVIRISGRTLVNGDALERLRSTGPVICLNVSLDMILQRLHVTMGARFHDPGERGLALSELKREWAIRNTEGVHEIDVTYLSTDEIIERVALTWQELAIQRI